MNPTGVCFNIQRYAIHDGPGIRTTVFMKGCPLSCSWCHNPEGLSDEPDVVFVSDRCVACGHCVEVCPNPPVRGADGRATTDRSACVRCGRCVEACAAGARRLVGRVIDVDELVREVERDRPFYEESGGGVTFSGGEPMAQPDFLLACLKELSDRGIHTAVDTSGCVERELMLSAAALTDLFLYDLKLMDHSRHRSMTGAELDPIVENLRALDASGADVWIRFPVIPGVTDDRNNVDALGGFVASLGRIRQVHLLPFHRTAADKYGRIGLEWKHRECERASNDLLRSVASRLADFGLDVRVGG